MRTVKFGYFMENGKLVIQNEEAQKLRTLYDAYMEESSLEKAGKKANLPFAHPTIKRYLSDDSYLEYGGFPPIIHQDLFHAVQEKLKKKKRKPRKKSKAPAYVLPRFHMKKDGDTKETGFARAEMLYERIEGFDEE